MTIFDLILGGLVMAVLGVFWRVVLFPVVMIVCTPFILIRAGGLAFRHRQKFSYAVLDGYESLWTIWWSSV